MCLFLKMTRQPLICSRCGWCGGLVQKGLGSRPEGRGQCGLIRMQWVTDGDAGDGCNKDEGFMRRGSSADWLEGGESPMSLYQPTASSASKLPPYICVAIIAIIPILNYRHIECVFHLCGKSAEQNCHQLAADLLLGWKWRGWDCHWRWGII